MFCRLFNLFRAFLRRFNGCLLRLYCFFVYGAHVKISGIPLIDGSISISIFPKGHLAIGKNLSVRKSVEFRCSAPVSIGDNCFFNNFCSIVSIEGISIGNDCLFGENVHIYDNNHVFCHENIPISNQGFSSKAICIGNNVWVESNVCILKGVSIGNNSVIAANSIVAVDVPENSIVKTQRIVDIQPIVFKNKQ